jgi:hypothetical protein
MGCVRTILETTIHNFLPPPSYNTRQDADSGVHHQPIWQPCQPPVRNGQPFWGSVLPVSRQKDIPLSSACFLLHRVQIKPDAQQRRVQRGLQCDCFCHSFAVTGPGGLGAYQSQYPLFIADKCNSLLHEEAMGTAINVTVKRGDVVEVIGKVGGQLPPAYEHYCVKEGHAAQFFSNGVLTWLTWVELWWQWTTGATSKWRSCWR